VTIRRASITKSGEFPLSTSNATTPQERRECRLLTPKQSFEIATAYLAKHPTRKLIPLIPGTKLPGCKEWQTAASNDPEVIRQWCTRRPAGPEWSLAHWASGTMSMDVDTKTVKGETKEGAATYAALLDKHPELAELTETITTGSGGKQYIYESELHVYKPDGFGPHIDSPGHTPIPGTEVWRHDDAAVGADVVGVYGTNDAPAIKAFAWFFDDYLGRPETETLSDGRVRAKRRTADLGQAREPLVLLDQESNVARAIEIAKALPPAVSYKGGDHRTLMAGMEMKDNGLSPEKAFEVLKAHFNVRCDPPWTDNDLRQKVANAYAYGKNRPGSATAAAQFKGEDESAEEAIAAIEAEQKADGRTEEIEKEIKHRDELRTVRRDWVYIAELNQFANVAQPKTIWKRESFDGKFGHLYPKGSLSAALLKESGAIRKFDRVAYVPGEGVAIDGGNACNLYRPSQIKPLAANDISFWDEHLEFLFPDVEQRELLLNWLGWFVQNIGRKPKHALLIQGRLQGTGKSFIADMLAKIIGEHNRTVVTQKDLAGNFNGFAMRSKLITIEELRALDKGSVKETLHELITQDRISINEKNMPKFEMGNCFGLIAFTNYDAPISIETGDRRYLGLKTNAAPRSVQYYADLYAKLDDEVAVGAVAHSLLNRDLGDYNGAGRAPLTAAKTEMIESGASNLAFYISEHLLGRYPLDGKTRVARWSDIWELFGDYYKTHKPNERQVAAELRASFGAVPLGFRPRLFSAQSTLWAFTGALGGRDPKTLRAGEAIEMFKQDRRIMRAEVAAEFTDDDLSFLDLPPGSPTLQ
jgi:hypothetical protein